MPLRRPSRIRAKRPHSPALIEAAEAGLIWPILVGPRATIEKIAAEEKLNIKPYPIEDAGRSPGGGKSR